MATILHILSILLLVLTPLSYWPQYTKLLSLQTTNGISVTATLILALCAQSQLPTMYYLFACPPFKRDGSVVPKPPRLMDFLNLAQILMQWVCSLLLLGLVLLARASSVQGRNVDSEPTADSPTPSQPQTDPTVTTESPITSTSIPSPSSRLAVSLIALHASLSIFWALLAGHPRRDWLDLPFITIMSINYILINPIITIATAAAFVIQQQQTSSETQPTTTTNTALCRRSLVLQTIVFAALAVLWPLRFRLPRNLFPPDAIDLALNWYALVGWPCVNNALVALGQGVVLLSGHDGAAGVPESEPLLVG